MSKQDSLKISKQDVLKILADQGDGHEYNDTQIISLKAQAERLLAETRAGMCADRVLNISKQDVLKIVISNADARRQAMLEEARRDADSKECVAQMERLLTEIRAGKDTDALKISKQDMMQFLADQHEQGLEELREVADSHECNHTQIISLIVQAERLLAEIRAGKGTDQHGLVVEGAINQLIFFREIGRASLVVKLAFALGIVAGEVIGGADPQYTENMEQLRAIGLKVRRGGKRGHEKAYGTDEDK